MQKVAGMGFAYRERIYKGTSDKSELNIFKSRKFNFIVVIYLFSEFIQLFIF